MREALWQVVAEQVGHTIEVRRELHRIPEPGLHEERTAELVAAELGAMGLNVRTEVGGTGVVADLDTGNTGRYVALRADMDALPVEDKTHRVYRSCHAGYSHCCGHDGHMAVVLGAVRVLTQFSRQMVGRVRMIFQPAEESSRGAKAMIQAGVLGERVPDAIFGVHAWPGLAEGTVACKAGPMMAACDAFTIRIIGHGGHGARPRLAKNPLMGVARAIETLSTLNSSDRVVSVCLARAGERANVIADTALLAGTVRSLTTQGRDRTVREIETSVRRTCAELDLQVEVRFEKHSPVVSTDESLYETFREVAVGLLGADRVIELDRPSMGGEDFGYYLQHVPGLMFRLGMGEDSPELHNSRFDFNDAALKSGMVVLAGLAMRICCGK